LADVEILPRIERRRQWTADEKAALMAEVAAEGGKVAVVARRHRISPSLLYNWRSAAKSAATATQAATALKFMPLGVFDHGAAAAPAMLPPRASEPSSASRSGKDDAGAIEITLPNGARVCVDALVNEKALSRVLRAMKGAI
jgi:transposase